MRAVVARSARAIGPRRARPRSPPKQVARGASAFAAARASSDRESPEAVAAEISRSGTPVLAANVKMDEITELGASTIATVALHEEVEMQVKVEVIKSKITISYG